MLIWQKTAPQSLRVSFGSPQSQSPAVSGLAALFAILLAIALFILTNQLWSDLIDWVFIKGSSNDLRVVLIHAAFVLPLLIVALALYLWLRQRRSYATVVSVPYFAITFIYTVRLLYDAGYYLVIEYQKVGIYTVLISLVLLFSALTYVLEWARHRSSVR